MKTETIKTYKHKTTGDIAELKNQAGYSLNRNTIGLIPVEYIEKSNDWEEIIQKDYEILTWYDRMMKSVSNCENCYSDIRSIRRLSDNEIFSLGDAVQSISGNWEDNDCKIEIIHARENGDIDFTINQNGTKGIYRNCLDNFRKAKKPVLFVTEDGVEIRIGDDYWVYDYGELKDTNHQIHKVYRASQTHTGDGVNRKYFSTKEKAEGYVVENKILLSLNDVISMNKISVDMNSCFIGLKEICKSRLK